LIVTGKLKKLWVKCSEWVKYRIFTLVALSLSLESPRPARGL
jgi:muconolactone delta-isomerase